MPAVDISPLMDHPGWKTISPAQRKQALDLWQAPDTTEDDRAQMRQVMESWASSAAQEPSGAARVVSSVGGMLREAPAMVSAASGIMGRAGGQAPNAPPGEKPQTPQQWEAALLPIEQQLEKGVNAIPGLMAGPAFGKAGYMGGQALSKLAAPWIGQTAAKALPALGEAGGNYLSRQANVAMGAEQAGRVGDIASLAVPLALRGATSAPVLRRAPGASVAQHEMAAEDIHRAVEGMQPATPAATLYRAVAQQHNPAIPAQSLRQTAEDIMQTEMGHGPRLRNEDVLGIAQEISALAEQYGDNIPMDRLYATMQRVGERLGGASRTDDIGTRELSRLYAAFHGALDNASQSNISGAETLQQAIKASRQEHAVERLQRITGEGRGITTQTGTGYTLVSGKKMLNEFNRLLADDDVFRGSFTADELADMRSVFEGANTVPALPPPGKVPVGSKQMWIRGAVAAPIGYALAGPQGATAATSAAILAPEAISWLMTTGRGRAMLKAAFEGRDTITPEVLAVLNQAARQIPETYTSKRSGSSAP